ncbi:MAG: hypothetical protein QF463_04730 [Vicinamibacterales bacterium]|mgnify:CR=1 FL=1|jgi:hypothetical protein|nr:hypothetical protein [Acidobacteriota bacterium]MDP6373918.1 hypothetical protein [Vicinamibacterales bacterium]MDP6608352.1 hypothetical protein [Vicinamibacterales bacterium]HAK55590.1 hypothetical protein [Acidobacteriota bacterium]|tara:strand:+ start:1532 stop:2197 length:666 start_codon:yes stop_codon:yes gene_type:complete
MIWNLFGNRRHLSDALLAEWSMGYSADTGVAEDGMTLPADAAEHLARCGHCQRRRDELVALLADVQTVARGDADAALTPQRLASQRQRITHRIAALVGSAAPARILRFPARLRSVPRSLGQHRWLPAAMAAGLVVGVFAGRMLDFTQGDEARPTAAVVATMDGDAFVSASRAVALRGAQGLLDDETILTEIDSTLATEYCEALDALDALTPRIQEVALAGR